MSTAHDFVSSRAEPPKTSLPDSMPDRHVSLLSSVRRTSAGVKSSRFRSALVVFVRLREVSQTHWVPVPSSCPRRLLSS